MKTKLNLRKLGVIIMLGQSLLSSANRNHACLEMLGNVKQAREWELGTLKNLDSAKFTIYNSNEEPISVSYSNESGMCLLNFPLNQTYKIIISKSGWVSKTIEVDTRISPNKIARYYLPFEIDMFEIVPELDASVLLQPIAHVLFNKYLHSFDYNFYYTDEVNARLKKLYSDYYCLRKKHKKDNCVIDNHEYVSNRVNDQLQTENLSVTNPTENFTKEVSVNIYESTPVSYNNIQRANIAPINAVKVYGAPESIIYKIQIYSLRNRMTPQHYREIYCDDINEYKYTVNFNYTLGEFLKISDARNSLEQVRKHGFNDAFIVAFKNGQRVSANQESLTNALGLETDNINK